MGNTCHTRSGVIRGKEAIPMAPNVFSDGLSKPKPTFAAFEGKGEPKSDRKESYCSKKPKMFLADNGRHGAAARETSGESHGAFGEIPSPMSGDFVVKNDVDRKTTRGPSFRKVYKITTRIFYRARRPSKVGAKVKGKGSRWSGRWDRGRHSVTSATQDLSDKYAIERSRIGCGFFGVVRKCANRKTGKEFAVKTIQKRKVRRIENLRREVAVMRCVDHPNIIKLYDVFEDDTFIHLVMELCTGGDLFDKMMEKRDSEEGHYSEEEAKVIVSQILSGIEYCHNEHICHRDLKLENFLIEGPNIKIIDFGLSRFVDGLSTMSTFVGTPYYMAPEILAHKYSKACDLWSLGVITFILLSGNMPFGGETDEEIFAAVKTGYFDFKAPEWNNISKKAKCFITQLLKKDPSARMTATQAMEHPWLHTLPSKRVSLAGVVKTEDGGGDVINLQDICHRLETFACMSEFHRRALYVMASELPEADIGHLRRVFRLIDQDGNGVISAEEIKRVLRQNGVACGRTGLGLMNMGTLCSDSISFREFAAAVVERDIVVREENIRFAFDTIHAKENSEITFFDLVKLLESEERALEAMNNLTLSKRDVITYEMFKRIMTEMLHDSKDP